MATLFNNHPYISSSKFFANWRDTATYVGMAITLCASGKSSYTQIKASNEPSPENFMTIIGGYFECCTY